MASADPQARIAMLERALNSAQHELRSTSHELQWAQLTIQKKDAVIRLLEERLRKQRIGFLGPPSETLSDLQLELLVEQEPSASREEVEAESRREPMTEPRKRQPHPGRKPLPESLPRVEEVIPCEAELHGCGGETKRDRLRHERSAGPRAGQVVCARDQTRKTFVRKMFRRCRCRSWRRASSTKGWPVIAWWSKRWWPSIAITFRCTGRKRFWNVKRAWRFRARPWMAG